ncbi:MAG: phage portal protein [Chloroflexi bacterium]|nr:phage portal protein [Chloroflexota bacterium]
MTQAFRNIKAFLLDGDGLKDIPFSAVTTSDLNRWFGSGKGATDPEKLYGRVGVLFRCLELRSQAIADLPRDILDEAGQPVDEDTLPFSIDLSDLLWRTELAQCLLARSYWHKEKNRVRLTGVRWLDPRTIRPVITEADGLTSFKRVLNGRLLPTPIDKEDMVWFWRPGLTEVGTGKAPGGVAGRASAVSDNVYTFLEKLFESGAIGTTVVFAENRPGKTDRGKLTAYLERVLTGIGNAFGIEVLSEAIRFQQLTPPLKDMVIPDLNDKMQRDICWTLGVALSLVFSDAANFAVSEKDDLHFYTKTIVPEYNFLAKQINKRLLLPLGLRLKARHDKLEIFQRMEIEKVQAAVELFDRGAIGLDELREAGGYQPRTPSKRRAAEDTATLSEGAEEDAADAKRARLWNGWPPEGNGHRSLEQERLLVERNADLERWQRKVVKAINAGRPAAGVTFDSKYVTPWEMAVIRRGLLNATTAEEVKAAFAAPFRAAPAAPGSYRHQDPSARQ